MDILTKIDHTILKPGATKAEVKQICDEAKQYGFTVVVVNPCWIPFCKKELAGKDIAIVTTLGFPLGQNLSKTKAAECADVIDAGADEIDMVINVGKLISGENDYAYNDIKGVADCCHSRGKICKVILETCLLTEEQIVRACELSEKAGADYVKTSTGFSSGGATVEIVKLMRKTCGPRVKIKAAGGIRNLAQAKAMVEAGADRLGTSAGLAIAAELSAGLAAKLAGEN
ncbi:deoxyribose-phosphate aldolase [Spirochaetia bacterium]|nr:deoxyribose-phosphate aldolase [Spirochaetia bacterium]